MRIRQKGILFINIIRLHRMHEMQAILTDVRGVCLSVSVTRLKSAAARAVYVACLCAGSFGAAFVELLWPLVIVDVAVNRASQQWQQPVHIEEKHHEETVVVTNGEQQTTLADDGPAAADADHQHSEQVNSTASWRPSVALRCWLGHLACRTVLEITRNLLSEMLSPLVNEQHRRGAQARHTLSRDFTVLPAHPDPSVCP